MRIRSLALCAVAFAAATSVMATSVRADVDDDGQEPWIGFQRCGALGDSLGGDLVEGRLAWSQNCYPKGKRYYTTAHRFVTPQGQRITLYPTFGTFDAAGAPTNPRAYQGGTRAEATCNLPGDYRVVALCIPGCFTPDQKVAYAGGELAIGAAASSKLTGVVTLASGASLDRLAFKTSDVAFYVSDLKEGQQQVLDFEMKSGGRLTVTEKHPMVDAEGGIRHASTFRPGDFLVREDGRLDEIEKISGRTYFGRVHNLNTSNAGALENVIVAQGYLTGSWYFQNLEVDHVNRLIMRENLPDALVQ